MTTPKAVSSTNRVWIICVAAVHTIVILALAWEYYYVVPEMNADFKHYQYRISGPSQMVVNLSTILVALPLLSVALVICLLVFDTAIILLLSTSRSIRIFFWGWSLVVLLLLLLFGTCSGALIWVPHNEMMRLLKEAESGANSR